MNISLGLPEIIAVITVVAAVYSFGATIWQKQDKRSCEKHRAFFHESINKVTELIAEQNQILSTITTKLDLQISNLQRQIDDLREDLDIARKLEAMEETLDVIRNSEKRN